MAKGFAMGVIYNNIALGAALGAVFGVVVGAIIDGYKNQEKIIISQ